MRLLLFLLTLALPAQSLPGVAILATGGTIASKQAPTAKGYDVALTGQDLVDAVPALKQHARIVTVDQIANVRSDDMTPAIWLKLADRINLLLARPDIAGIVVTHGTDTMEETAYFLDLTVTSNKPVVLVGSQRPASDPDSDGPRNLLNAVRVAVSPEAIGKGTLIVMNGQINAARDVTKTNTMAVETFQSLEFGLLGTVDVRDVRFYRAPTRRQTIPLKTDLKDLPRVDIIPSYIGNDGSVVTALLAQDPPDGLVIAGNGVGNTTTPLYDALLRARAKGLALVVATRVLSGRVIPLQTGPGSSQELQAHGAILSDNLSPQKARILLMLGLTQTKDPAELQKFFNH